MQCYKATDCFQTNPDYHLPEEPHTDTEHCFSAYPFNEGEAVQQGLTRDFDVQPPTWKVPIAAMKCAEIEQEHMQDLKVVLGMLFIVVCTCTCE